MKVLNPYTEIFAGLGPKHILLTVNQRLALHLQNEYSSYQQAQGKKVWQADVILSFSAWLDAIWQRLSLLEDDLPMALNCHQEKKLWQEIIQNSEQGKNFLHITGTVYEAQQAWQTLQQWCVGLSEIPSYYTDDVEAFVSWAKAFKKRCQQEGWISSCERLSLISDRLEKGKWAEIFPESISLFGFEEYTPQVERFRKFFHRGEVLLFEKKGAGEVLVKACHDKEAELRHAMDFALKQVTVKPHSSIAIVVPDLAQNREQVERLASEVLGENYNISAAKPLSDYCIVADALGFLALRHSRRLEDLSQVIRSPFLKAAETEMFCRAQLDIELRQKASSECHFKECMMQLRHSHTCPDLLGLLEQYQNYPIPQKAYLSEWIEHFTALLNIMAWPGERGLNSAEYQAVAKFYEALDAVVSLNPILGSCSYQKALSALNQVMSDMLFQPENTATVGISILGILEASGLPFDAIWLCGLSDDKWPAAASPNAFLPISLQVQKNMPHASADREYRYAAQLMKEIKAHCHSLTLSYPCWQGDIALNPSPLLHGYEKQSCGSIGRYSESLFNNGQDLEFVQDHYGLSLNEFEAFQAGSALFKDQSLCPFKAYAGERLEVKAFPEFMAYLDSSIQGNIIHSILQEIWTELQDSTNLHTKSEADLGALIAERVSKVLEVYRRRYSHLFNEALFNIEQQRLVDLMQAWMECEKQRATFKVLALEQKTLTEMGGIPLALRIDRVDELQNGELAVIDYKTGKASAREWFPEKMISPQLPLYAVVKNAQAIAFAKVNASDKKGFDGMAVEADLIPKVKKVEDWNALLFDWKKQLLKLADEFKQGYAVVRPLSYLEACQHCDFERLCRVDYQNLEHSNNDEDEEADD
ncbi:MAG: repair protein [Gammaproteobacteria bacterium]|jgi:probable DNA repair protein|nr:repair protein [Gammaproteobacteria bacterium]